MKISVINSTDKNRFNCVIWLRVERGKKFPSGQWTISDKVKIINTKIPQVGAIVVMNIGVWYWRKGKKVFSGHLGEVRKVVKRSNDYYITIIEANRVRGCITEASGTERELSVLGYRISGSPAPAPAPTPPKPKYQTYYLRKGENCYLLTQRYKISYNKIYIVRHRKTAAQMLKGWLGRYRLRRLRIGEQMRLYL